MSVRTLNYNQYIIKIFICNLFLLLIFIDYFAYNYTSSKKGWGYQCGAPEFAKEEFKNENKATAVSVFDCDDAVYTDGLYQEF